MAGRTNFDPEKDAINQRKHGLSLANFVGFDTGGVGQADKRYDYGEVRYRAFGRIGLWGYCIVYTIRDGEVRLISFRRAHEKEMRRYE